MLTLNGLRKAARSGAIWTVAAWCISLCGCASADGAPEKKVEEPPDNGVPTEQTITFTTSDTLTLSPSELSLLRVEVSPNNRQDVAFEILTENQSFDGFLVEPVARVQADGTASVELHAPSQASIFNVRASLSQGPEAIRAVSVSANGYGTIRIQPLYEGTRDIQQWTASARADHSCGDIDSYWDDGPLIATGSSAATISDVPVGVPIAVTLRGGRLVSGCTTLPGLIADETRETSIEVKDRPIDLESGVLSISLGVESSTTSYASHLEQAISVALAHFRGDAQSEGEALLTWMAWDLNETSSATFLSAVESHDLVTIVDQLYGNSGPVTNAISGILTSAANRISGEGVFRGALTLESGVSQFLLTEAAGVPAAVSGFFPGSTWAASVDSEDTVVLGGNLTYEPLRWLVSIAEHTTEIEASPTSQVAAAARCQEVAVAILTAADGPTHEDCEEECLEGLCINAVSDLWDSMHTLGSNLATLQLGMSGTATLFGPAQVERISGTWLGRLMPDETSIRGPATAERITSP